LSVARSPAYNPLGVVQGEFASTVLDTFTARIGDQRKLALRKKRECGSFDGRPFSRRVMENEFDLLLHAEEAEDDFETRSKEPGAEEDRYRNRQHPRKHDVPEGLRLQARAIGRHRSRDA
jgi:hypothetical protein